MKSWHSQCCFIKSVLGNCTLFSRHTSFFVFPILYLSIEIDQNRSKSIKINHNRTKSIITRNCVIDFYRFPIFVDWFVSTTIDNNRILLTIRIIDMLRPEIRWNHWLRCFLGKEFLLFCSLSGSYPSIVLILANTFLIRPTQAVLASHGAIKDYPGNLSQSKSTAGFPPIFSKQTDFSPPLPSPHLPISLAASTRVFVTSPSQPCFGCHATFPSVAWHPQNGREGDLYVS